MLVSLKRIVEVWTSGTNDGVGCLRKHGWCPSGQFFPPDLKFGPGEGVLYADTENGVTLYFNTGPASKSVLRDHPASERHYYICEVMFRTSLDPK
jgi:hypothetical protein